MANFGEKNDTKGVFLHAEFIFGLKKDIRECFGGQITNIKLICRIGLSDHETGGPGESLGDQVEP